MAKKVVPPKKAPTIKKPETPAPKGIHVIIESYFKKIFWYTKVEFSVILIIA